MSNNANQTTTNTNTTDSVAAVQQQMIDLSNTDHIKELLGAKLIEIVGVDGYKKLTTEQINYLVGTVTEEYLCDTITSYMADGIAERTLCAVDRMDWWGDKALGAVIDTGVKALLIGGGVYAYQKFNEKSEGDTLPNASSVGESPFSETGFAASPRPLRKRSEVGSISSVQ